MGHHSRPDRASALSLGVLNLPCLFSCMVQTLAAGKNINVVLAILFWVYSWLERILVYVIVFTIYLLTFADGFLPYLVFYIL